MYGDSALAPSVDIISFHHTLRRPTGSTILPCITVELQSEDPFFFCVVAVIAELMRHKLCDEHAAITPIANPRILMKVIALFFET
jgi:hypothetical protein